MKFTISLSTLLLLFTINSFSQTLADLKLKSKEISQGGYVASDGKIIKWKIISQYYKFIKAQISYDFVLFL